MRRSSRTVNARIHRLAGQLNAIESMLRQRRSCSDVLQQISAVRAGLGQVAAIVFQTELQKLSAKRTLTAADVAQLTKALSTTN